AGQIQSPGLSATCGTSHGNWPRGMADIDDGEPVLAQGDIGVIAGNAYRPRVAAWKTGPNARLRRFDSRLRVAGRARKHRRESKNRANAGMKQRALFHVDFTFVRQKCR